MSVEPLVVAFEVSVPPAQALKPGPVDAQSGGRRHTQSAATPRPSRSSPAPEAASPSTNRTEASTNGGEILDWEPPARLRYLWHLFFDPTETTEVEVTFTPTDHGTVVRLEHRGWAQLGELGPRRRGHTQHAWHKITDRYIRASSRSPAAEYGPPGP